MELYSTIIKPFFDKLFAFVLIFVLSPVFFIVALVLKFSNHGAIIFRQERPGKNCKPFLLYKFKTMLDPIDKNGSAVSSLNRVTPLGSFLRKWSLDELPQLLNVLMGEMSIVGPRPLMMEYIPKYTPEQLKRHDVVPGITGWAQVHGRNAVPWEEKFLYDTEYVQKQSFLMDFKILIMTIWVVISRKGIHQKGFVGAPAFEGVKVIDMKSENENIEVSAAIKA
jgi:lipopolysaccharide/colanic/teichoic acid biosynthesis glycosyltransferase